MEGFYFLQIKVKLQRKRIIPLTIGNMSATNDQYDAVIAHCREIFSKKMYDYGSAWRILRTSSLTDQIFIKAQRIRTVQTTGQNKVGEDLVSEFVGIINYAIMALMQLELSDNENMDLLPEDADAL